VSWDTVFPGYRPLSWGYPGMLRMPPVSHDANLRFQTKVAHRPSGATKAALEHRVRTLCSLCSDRVSGHVKTHSGQSSKFAKVT